MRKRALSLILAAVMVCALAAPAAARDTGRAGEQNIISVGDYHTATIDKNGTLWMWGDNYYGELGNDCAGNTADGDGDPIQTVPVRVMENVASVSCGYLYTAALKTDGTLWTWGSNEYGKLGNGYIGNAEDGDGDLMQTVPVQIMENVAAVSCGSWHTAAIKTDGTLWTWGYNEYGQLGNGGVGNEETEDGYPYQTTPVKVMDHVAAVCCGRSRTAAIKTDGTLWMWGDNEDGELGNGEKASYEISPVKVMDDVATVSCGPWHTAAVKTDGTLWTWGYNGSGELGNGGIGNAEDLYGTPIQTVPMKVLDSVATVNCGTQHTAAVGTDGALWMWGMNNIGQLGDGDVEDSAIPVQVMNGVATVRCGKYYTAALKTDGTLWTWGSNEYGQLGNGGVGNIEACYDYDEDGATFLALTIPTQIALEPAYASTQTVDVDGRDIEFQCYALKDEKGNMTNYIKLRDLAILLNGSAAQFQVGWDGSVTITTKAAYTPNGSELSTPFSGDRPYEETAAVTKVDGVTVDLAAFVLKDDDGGGYTYYQLRDLGKALGFNVGWAADRGIYLETDKPYDPNN